MVQLNFQSMKKTTKPQPKDTINVNHLFKSRGKRYAEGLVINTGSFLILGGTGFLLDYLFNTKPIFLIIFIIISFFVAQYILFKRLKKFAETLKNK